MLDIIIYIVVFVVGLGVGYSICKNGSKKADELYNKLKEEYEELKAKANK